MKRCASKRMSRFCLAEKVERMFLQNRENPIDAAPIWDTVCTHSITKQSFGLFSIHMCISTHEKFLIVFNQSSDFGESYDKS